jgi:hypothetical protein
MFQVLSRSSNSGRKVTEIGAHGVHGVDKNHVPSVGGSTGC